MASETCPKVTRINSDTWQFGPGFIHRALNGGLMDILMGISGN